MRRPLVFLAVALAACDPVYGIGVAARPSPAIPLDSARRDARRIAEGVAARHGLLPYRVDATTPSDSNSCYRGGTLILCTHDGAHAVGFSITELQKFQATARGDSVRRELLDGLGGRFGREQVWQCSTTPWRCADLAPPKRADTSAKR